MPCSPADPDRLLRVEGDQVRASCELGVREIDARVDDRDRHPRRRRREPVDPDLLAPPLVELERIRRHRALGDGVCPLGLQPPRPLRLPGGSAGAPRARARDGAPRRSRWLRLLTSAAGSEQAAAAVSLTMEVGADADACAAGAPTAARAAAESARARRLTGNKSDTDRLALRCAESEGHQLRRRYGRYRRRRARIHRARCQPGRPGGDDPARAVELLGERSQIEVLAVSQLRDNEPWGYARTSRCS